jgi:hypothetical protein
MQVFGLRPDWVPGNELLRDLPLEFDAVGTLSGHGSHPLKAQLASGSSFFNGWRSTPGKRKRLSTMTVRSKAFAYAREPISITPPAPIRSRRPITPLTSARRALAVPLGPAIFDRGGLPFVVLSPLTYFIVIKYELPKPVS